MIINTAAAVIPNRTPMPFPEAIEDRKPELIAPAWCTICWAVSFVIPYFLAVISPFVSRRLTSLFGGEDRAAWMASHYGWRP